VKAASSSEHWKLLDSSAENLKLADVLPFGFGGLASIAVSGARVSIVQV
jgi:hypothetical protein